ncbi:hypothetical protein D3875_20020 [Deinococcus cavernae]|uniref:Uncharacterized protein n=1 Tax=Deinococcus cavernae TaxID=2320857 RepID=A0A418VBG9_9DEIO|nr:hypothetical protein [Deinococcus cavernae]RJF73491.1 hypothetical protein D3875_20020 [Deinococcus cavernae]
MNQFLQVEGESVWINIHRVDGLMVRPQLRAVGSAHGEGLLEELHESTGMFELAAYFQGQLIPVLTFPSREEAEQAVMKLIGSRVVRDL